jgi:uncharacterized protein involved in exopolysaccharide biosynthesis
VLPGKKYSPGEIARILVRRRWVVLLPFAVGLAATSPIDSAMPECSSSEALIGVALQHSASDTKFPAAAAPADRLASMTDRILSGSQLERLIRELDLYRGALPDGSMEHRVQRMRSDIHVKAEGNDSFRVGYVNCDPQIAQTVTARLASLYLDENTRTEKPPASSGRSEQFRIVNPATLPAKPHHQVQLTSLVAGAVGGLAFGLALIALLEYRNSSFSCEEDLSRVLALPVLGIVPVMASERELRAQRYRLRAVDFGGCVVLLMAVVLVLWRLRS